MDNNDVLQSGSEFNDDNVIFNGSQFVSLTENNQSTESQAMQSKNDQNAVSDAAQENPPLDPNTQACALPSIDELEEWSNNLVVSGNGKVTEDTLMVVETVGDGHDVKQDSNKATDESVDNPKPRADSAHVCTRCARKFRYAHLLRQHDSKCSKDYADDVTTPYQCRFCMRHFQNSQNLNEHTSKCSKFWR